MSELSPASQAAINAVQAELDKCYQRIDEREHALSALANEMIYRGNSVAYIYAKKDAYAKCIDECCACFQMDGETSVAEYVKRSVERVKELQRELATWKKSDELTEQAHALARKECDDLKRENAELKSQRNALASLIWETRWVSEDHDYQNIVGIAAEIRSGSLTGLNKETANRDQLLLQVARLREALEKVVRTFGIPAEYDRVAQQALAETQSQSAKEVLGRAVELLRMACDDGEGNLDRAKKLGEDISKFHPTVPLYRKEIARLERLCE